MKLSTNLPKPVLILDYIDINKKKARQLRMPLRVLIFQSNMEFEALILESSMALIKRHEILEGFKFKEVKDIVRLICKIYLELDYNKLSEEEYELLKIDQDKAYKKSKVFDVYDKRIEYNNQHEPSEWDEEVPVKIKGNYGLTVRKAFTRKQEDDHDLNKKSTSERMEEIKKIRTASDGDENDFDENIVKRTIAFTGVNVLNDNRVEEDVDDLLQLIDKNNEYKMEFEDDSSDASIVEDENIIKSNGSLNNTLNTIQNRQESLPFTKYIKPSSSIESLKTSALSSKSASRLFTSTRNIEVSEIMVSSPEFKNDTARLVSSFTTLRKRFSIKEDSNISTTSSISTVK